MNKEPTNRRETTAASDAGTGYLIVQVTTARGAIPLEGATVDVRSFEPEVGSDPATRGDVVASLVSGHDGNTVRIPLSAPPRSASETPGNGRPYALYQIEVSLEGFFDQTYIGVPIFDGITAIQPVNMIPLPENGTTGIPRPESTRFFEGEGADL